MDATISVSGGTDPATAPSTPTDTANNPFPAYANTKHTSPEGCGTHWARVHGQTC